MAKHKVNETRAAEAAPGQSTRKSRINRLGLLERLPVSHPGNSGPVKIRARIRTQCQSPTSAAWLVLPLCAACAALNVSSEEAPTEKAKADALVALIAKLEDEAFAVRKDAETALLAGGQAALDAVRNAARRKDLSPEKHEHLDRIAARLEGSLAWDRIAKPRRADFATGKVKVTDALNALKTMYGVEVNTAWLNKDCDVNVKLADAPWSDALAEIARQAHAEIDFGFADQTSGLSLSGNGRIEGNPRSKPALECTSGCVVQGICIRQYVLSGDTSGEDAKTDKDRIQIMLEAFAQDACAMHCGRNALDLVLVDSHGNEHPVKEEDPNGFFDQNRITLEPWLLERLGEEPFEVNGRIVWRWPTELRKYVFKPQEDALKAKVAGSRSISISMERDQDKFSFHLTERVQVMDGATQPIQGWFTPFTNEGKRLVLDSTQSFSGAGNEEGVPFTEYEATWTLNARPAEIVYEYPVGFEKRELAFHLKGLTLPKAKPKEPEMP